jgi:hypothetical protein
LVSVINNGFPASCAIFAEFEYFSTMLTPDV